MAGRRGLLLRAPLPPRNCGVDGGPTTIEFIGIAATQRTGVAQPPSSGPQDPVATQSEAGQSTGAVVQPDYLRALARTHEESGFDRMLIAHASSSPDGFTVAEQILTHTDRVGVLVAHRPGFVSPTLAARKVATLDACHPGRVAMHVITGATMPTAQAVRAGGNSTALVGTPETVAAALLDYVDIGATTLLIRGYDPYDDAIDYGRELLPSYARSSRTVRRRVTPRRGVRRDRYR